MLAGSFQVLSVRKKFSSMENSPMGMHITSSSLVEKMLKNNTSVAQHMGTEQERVCVCVQSNFQSPNSSSGRSSNQVIFGLSDISRGAEHLNNPPSLPGSMNVMEL